MSELDVSVRRATLEDIDTIAEFNCQLALETEDKSLDRGTVLEGVRRGLQCGDEVTYFVAEFGATTVGTLMLTREWSDWRNGWLAWLQSVYVREEYRGRGVFRCMLDQVIDMTEKQPDVLGLRLYVETENNRAHQVYERSGFVDPNYKVLERMRLPTSD